MAFPQTPLDVDVDLQIGGAWTDITQYVYTNDAITITRGEAPEASTADPGSCHLTLNNRDGRFSPRNPVGPYYGLIGRNTPLRVSVNTGAAYLGLDGNPTGVASTPDHASLDIAGDMDLRAEVGVDWQNSTTPQVLLGKWNATGNQRSYMLRIYNGTLSLFWSTDGTLATTFSAFATLPDLPHRAAVRATLVLNDGTGNSVVTCYWAPTLAGPWTSFGSFSFASTAAIFNSTAPLTIGGNEPGTTPPRVPFTGEGHRFEVRNGIGGTVVANPDFTTRTPGATSFADSTGKTWSTVGTARITNRRTRFVGEVSEWPSRWSVDGKDIWVQVAAAGLLRRLGQGSSPLQSPMRREFTNPARTSIVAYWPCEDGSDVRKIGSALPQAQGMAVSGTGLAPASDDTWAASDPLPVVNGAVLRGVIPAYTSTDQIALRMAIKLPPGGVAAPAQVLSIATTGTAATWFVVVNSSAQMALLAQDPDGVVIKDTGYIPMFANGDMVSLGLELKQVGADISYALLGFKIADMDINQSYTYPGTSGTLTGRTVGRARSIAVNPYGGLGETTVGHIAVAKDTTAYGNTFGALIGWTGETGRARITRLMAEEGLNLTTTLGGDHQVGPQRSADLLSLLGAAADVVGTLYEQRDTIGLALRCRETQYNQRVGLTLDYAVDLAPPLEPTDDDQAVRNDITVTRDSGASARATLDSGPVSTLPPPNGVGRYDSNATLNLYNDDQPTDHAGWLLNLGTWDETRYPVVRVDLAARPSLIEAATAMDTGDRLTIRNPPRWLPPDTIDLLIRGYAETINLYSWELTYNTVPAGPWTVAVNDDPVTARADTDGSQLAAAITTPTQTSISVATTSGPLWTTDPAEAPFDLRVGGEVVRVTAVAGTTSPQTMTVTRSVNGVTKTHTAGADVRLAQPAILSL